MLLTWLKEVSESYQCDKELQEIIASLIVNAKAKPPYTYAQGLLRYKGRVVIGLDEDLRARVMQAVHDSSLGGHSGGSSHISFGEG